MKRRTDNLLKMADEKYTVKVVIYLKKTFFFVIFVDFKKLKKVAIAIWPK